MSQGRANEILHTMDETRAATLALFDLAREEDLHRSPGFGFRPIIWHLAHIGVFESYWILQQLKGEMPLDERYLRIFDPIKTPRENSVELPSRREMQEYLARVRERVQRHLQQTDFTSDEPLTRNGYLFDLVLQHEYQHQETLAYLLHLLDPQLKSDQQKHRNVVARNDALHAHEEAAPRDMISIPRGAFEMGSVWDAFAYDNETPAQKIELPAFRIDRQLTTNDEYARFIAADGYEQREWWSDEGWEWKEKEGWTQPLYWQRRGDDWHIRAMFAEDVLPPDHPVCGISWYEAEAYTRFCGKRLPTEAEWEKAASWDAARERKNRYAWGDEAPSPALCNYGQRYWGTTPTGSFPAGASAYGCLDMTGNVWEWTSDAFRGYPNFKAFPYEDYSEAWFDDDHRVLKGGSWATSAPILRTSFRNFFRRNFRIAFAGIRCAAD